MRKEIYIILITVFIYLLFIFWITKIMVFNELVESKIKLNNSQIELNKLKIKELKNNLYK